MMEIYVLSGIICAHFVKVGTQRRARRGGKGKRKSPRDQKEARRARILTISKLFFVLEGDGVKMVSSESRGGCSAVSIVGVRGGEDQKIRPVIYGRASDRSEVST